MGRSNTIVTNQDRQRDVPQDMRRGMIERWEALPSPGFLRRIVRAKPALQAQIVGNNCVFDGEYDDQS
jgi:hypothetical protein